MIRSYQPTVQWLRRIASFSLCCGTRACSRTTVPALAKSSTETQATGSGLLFQTEMSSETSSPHTVR